MLFQEKTKFDLIMSIGGNCAAASQLKKRGLRPFSLPFDYTFMANSRPIEYFAEGLKDGFKNFCLKENLEELQGDERGIDTEKIQYKDNYSQYRFIHLFKRPVTEEGAYEEAKSVLDKRIKRMLEKINEAKKILVLCSTTFSYDENCIYNLKETFEQLYPEKQFTFVFIMLESDECSEKENGNVLIIRSKRCTNLYDFNNTNWEWHFLDMVRLTKKPFDSFAFSFKLGNRRISCRMSWERFK